MIIGIINIITRQGWDLNPQTEGTRLEFDGLPHYRSVRPYEFLSLNSKIKYSHQYS